MLSNCLSVGLNSYVVKCNDSFKVDRIINKFMTSNVDQKKKLATISINNKRFNETLLAKILFKHKYQWVIYETNDKEHEYIVKILDKTRDYYILFKNRKEIDIDIELKSKNSDINQSIRNALFFHWALYPEKGRLFHASSIMYKNKVMLFLGESGAGKTTIAELFKTNGVSVINDDRILIAQKDDKFFAYGIPWGGSAEIAESYHGEIGSIYFLKSDKTLKINTLHSVSKMEVISGLLKRSMHAFWDENQTQEFFDFCFRIAQNIQCFELSFTPDSSAVEFILGSIEKESSLNVV